MKEVFLLVSTTGKGASLPNSSCISKSYIKIKINWNFYFNISLWYLKSFMKGFKAFKKPFAGPQRIVKIIIWVNFLSSSGIGTGRVKNNGTSSDGFWISCMRKVSTNIRTNRRHLRWSTFLSKIPKYSSKYFICNITYFLKVWQYKKECNLISSKQWAT